MPLREPSPTKVLGLDGLPLLVLPEGTRLERGYTTFFLAAGGMSIAYRGTRAGKQYFLKEALTSDEHFYRALLREKDLLKKLSHPGIPRYLEDFEQDGFHYLVTDFIAGSPLSSQISSDRKEFLTEAEVIQWGIEICDILAYLHAQQPPIIYRDLKPRNIMRREDGKIFLVDFGIARTFKISANKDTKAMGTARTASPEHFSGQTDARSDVYTLGATLHLLLANGRGSGIEPFEFTNLRKVNPAVTEHAEAMVSQALMIDPKKRFPSMLEFKKALASLPKEPQNSNAEKNLDRSSGSASKFISGGPPARLSSRQVLAAGLSVAMGGAKPSTSISTPNPRPSYKGPRRRVRNLQFHLTLYSRQFATLLNSGMAIVRAMDILGKQCEDPKLAEILKDVAKIVESGGRLSQAFSAHPDIFPEVFVSLVTIGENTGQMNESLFRLALLLERQDRVKRRVKAALAYPAFVLGLSTLLALLISWTVLPNFMTIFQSMKVSLPMPTQVLMLFASSIRKPGFWLFCFGAGLLASRALKLAWQNPEKRRAIFSSLCRLPLIGPILQASTLSRYCWVMKGTLATGLELIRSLKLAGDASGSPILAGDSARVIHQITAGSSLAKTLRASGDYPNMLCQLVLAGEEVGNLSTSFRNVATFYDEELDYKLDTLTAALEPILMAGLSILVGGVVIAIFLPLYGFITNLGS